MANNEKQKPDARYPYPKGTVTPMMYHVMNGYWFRYYSTNDLATARKVIDGMPDSFKLIDRDGNELERK